MSMRKRKTLNVKRVTTRSIGGGFPKFLTSIGDSMPNTALVSEGFMMEREEKMQRMVDNFWGLDKDLKDRLHEQEEMSLEDQLSMVCESTQRMMGQHQKWEEEFVLEQRFREEQEREDRVQQRLHHLRLINSPAPVEEVLTAIWGLDEHHHTPLLPNIASLSLNSLYSAPNVKKMLEEGQSSEAQGDPSLLSLEAVRMPLHLEGLQRSREIIDQARNNIKAALKEIYATSLNSLDTKPAPLALPESSQKKTAAAPQLADKVVKEAVEKAAQEEAYNPLLWGHAMFHWDQSAMLQAVFNMLDRDNRGYITAESLQRISHDSSLHELLQFTVLWVFVKKRDWAYFFKLMETYEEPSTATPFPVPPLSRNPSKLRDKHSDTSSRHLAPIGKSPSFRSNHSSQSNSGPPPKSVSYQRWMQAAEVMTRESRVSVRRIRTQDEHTFHCSLLSFRHDYWDNDHHGVIRNYRLLRCLKVGDCVWGLHRNGVRWLPAVIEHVHTNPAQVLSADTLERSSWIFESTDQGGIDALVDGVQYTYDLWYPLSERDLVQSRLSSTSKQLLTLPSQAVTEGVQPKPFLDERSACAYAFDLADTTSAGVLELESLIVSMQSQEMQRIIETSVVLAAIFTEKLAVSREPLLMIQKLKKKRISKVRTATRPMLMLLHVFVDTFSTQPESEEGEEYPEKSDEHKAENQSEDADKKKDVIDCVSKTDFLEFCDAVLTLIKYDIHVVRSQ